MTAIGQYGFINAKVRTMRSYLLTKAIYHNLITAKNHHEMMNVLAPTYFNNIIDELKYQDSLEIEQKFFWEEIRRIFEIKKFSRGTLYKVISLLIERYDIEKLKIILRVWYSNTKNVDGILWKRIIYDFPVDAMLEAKDLKEMIPYLLSTPYGEIVDKFVSEHKEFDNLFYLELLLDQYNFKRLLNAGAELNRLDQRIFKRLVGIEIDLKNLDWINRFKNYYHFSYAEILQYLLPYGYRLDQKEIQRMVKAENTIKAIFQHIKGLKVQISENMETEVSIEVMEKILYQILFIEAKKAFREFPFSIGAILGYFYLMRIEMKNIRTIIKAKGYNLSPQEIENLIII
jgi:vacuolar-type H+-ATPase subunit C/Vma6